MCTSVYRWRISSTSGKSGGGRRSEVHRISDITGDFRAIRRYDHQWSDKAHQPHATAQQATPQATSTEEIWTHHNDVTAVNRRYSMRDWHPGYVLVLSSSNSSRRRSSSSSTSISTTSSSSSNSFIHSFICIRQQGPIETHRHTHTETPTLHKKKKITE